MRKKTLFFCSSLSCFAWTSGGEGTIFQRQPRWRPDFFKKGVYVQYTFNIIQIINWKNCEFQNPKDHLLQTFHESFGGVSICEETPSQGSWMDPCIPAFFFFGGGRASNVWDPKISNWLKYPWLWGVALKSTPNVRLFNNFAHWKTSVTLRFR